MNKHIAKILTLKIKDKHKRWLKQIELIEGRIDPSKIKLFMTLVVKNEEDVIEKNIRFHYAMGVDGFIVTNHNSTDKTQEILLKLKEEGIVKEIINETCVKHEHNKWVHKMIKIAKWKYHADWIINADADELYYSKDWNLKFTLAQFPKINVIKLESNFVFPNDECSTFENPYFIKNPIKDGEMDMLKKKYADTSFNEFSRTGAKTCPKVIHKTKGYIKIEKGNHNVEMRNKIMAQSDDIVLYHYHLPNYCAYEQKALRWKASASLLTKGENYLTELIKRYENGTLKEYYDDIYAAKKEILLERGILVKDCSIDNFMKEKGLI